MTTPWAPIPPTELTLVGRELARLLCRLVLLVVEMPCPAWYCVPGVLMVHSENQKTRISHRFTIHLAVNQ